MNYSLNIATAPTPTPYLPDSRPGKVGIHIVECAWRHIKAHPGCRMMKVGEAIHTDRLTGCAAVRRLVELNMVTLDEKLRVRVK